MSDPRRRRRSSRRGAIVSAQLAAAVVLLLLAWRLVDGPEALRLLTTAQWGWLVVALALLMLHTVLAALRWRVTAAGLDITLTRREALSEYFLAQLVNTTLPGGVLGDAGRVARSRHDAGLAPAAGAVVVERVIGQLALLTVLGWGFLLTLILPTSVVWPRGIAVTIALVLSVSCVAMVVATVILCRAPPRPDGRLARLADGIRRSVASPGVARTQAVLSAGTTGCILAAFACCAAAVGAPLPVIAVVAVVPLVLLAMLVPISVGGWGVREGAAVALLPVAGVTGSEALATSVAFGVLAVVAALPGLTAIWARRPIRR